MVESSLSLPSPVGEEPEIFQRAEGDLLHRGGGETELPECESDGPMKVENEALPVSGEEAFREARLRKEGHKLFADGVAPTADGGADPEAGELGQLPSRGDGESLLEERGKDSPLNPPPSGVKGGHEGDPGVVGEDGHAVGGLDDQGEAPACCQKAVGLGEGRERGVQGEDGRGVNLLEQLFGRVGKEVVHDEVPGREEAFEAGAAEAVDPRELNQELFSFGGNGRGEGL